MELLRQKILSYVEMEEEELAYSLTFFRKALIPKGEFLLKAGEYCLSFFYVNRGCLSCYTLFNGEEQFIEFFTENDLFTDLYNYIEEIPSNCYLRATEDSEVYSIDKKDMEHLFASSKKWERMGRLFLQDEFVKVQRRASHSILLSNEERYKRLRQKRPTLIQRVPQYMIASYLGITPVGLSKIRKRLRLT